MPFALYPFSRVLIPMVPDEGTLPIRLVIFKFAFVDVCLLINFVATPMFKIVIPMTFVNIAIFMENYSNSMFHALPKLPIIVIVFLENFLVSF